MQGKEVSHGSEEDRLIFKRLEKRKRDYPGRTCAAPWCVFKERFTLGDRI